MAISNILGVRRNCVNAFKWQIIFLEHCGAPLFPSFQLIISASNLLDDTRQSYRNLLCQVHDSRNVICKVPKVHKKSIVDHLRNIFYADSRTKALEFFAAFKEKNEEASPSDT
jgi:hypothetical protein